MKPLTACSLLLLLATGLAFAQAPRTPPTPARSINVNLKSIDGKILEMAKDFPEDLYSFRLKPEMRSFGEVLVHIVAGNIYAAKVGRGDTKAQWDELDAAKYKTKAEIVALLEKNFADSESVAAGLGEEHFKSTLSPWLAVIEHNGEHYGLLVAYYRANGKVPPETRKANSGD